MRWLYVILLICLMVTILSLQANAKDLSRSDIESLIIRTALKYDVDPNLALAIAEVESHMNPNMIGIYGEIGIFQLRPEYHNVKKEDVVGNIRTGIQYLSTLKVRCARLDEAFFICYNNGPSRTPKHPKLFPYYKLVMNQMEKKND